jgi:hypothetical protein
MNRDEVRAVVLLVASTSLAFLVGSWAAHPSGPPSVLWWIAVVAGLSSGSALWFLDRKRAAKPTLLSSTERPHQERLDG